MIALDDLPPITLADLVDRAAPLTRVDREYVLPIADLPAPLGAPQAALRCWRCRVVAEIRPFAGLKGQD